MEEIKAKLNDLLADVDKEYRKWYKRKAKQSFVLWLILQLMAITPGFVVSILVAISNDTELVKNKPWIVVLTAIGSFVGFILVQFKVYDIWKIRADGELAFENLYRLAVSKIAMVQTQDECFKAYDDIRDLIQEIESDAVKRYFSLSTSNFVATWKGK